MKSIGWIGVGIMGKPMVRNLQKAGYTLHIYARNREKVADVIQEGAIFHDTIGDCAQGRDAVITMVGLLPPAAAFHLNKNTHVQCDKYLQSL